MPAFAILWFLVAPLSMFIDYILGTAGKGAGFEIWLIYFLSADHP